MHDHSVTSHHFVTRCQNGCFHLVWGGVTLHMSEAEFAYMANIVAAASEQLRADRSPTVSEDAECADSHVM